MPLRFRRLSGAHEDHAEIEIDRLVVAGWAGRDATAIRHHIDELAALGVPPPSATPLYYRVGAHLLTQAEQITVLGPDSSGEVEPVIVAMADGLWVGIGSDHTDRRAETHGVALSKQLCAKPVGRDLWSYADIEDHWDRLEIRSWATIDGARVRYQDSLVSTLRTPRDLIHRYTGARTLPTRTLLFCGTPSCLGTIRPGSRFEMEIRDPVLGRSLTHAYDVDDLPIVA